jgi:hypothetical protein
MSAVLQVRANDKSTPKTLKNLRFVDATSDCLDNPSLSKMVANYEGVLADPRDLTGAKQALEHLFIGDDPSETLIIIDGWFDESICPPGKNNFSPPALEMFRFVTDHGFHAVVFRGEDDGREACSLAALEVVQGYLS